MKFKHKLVLCIVILLGLSPFSEGYLLRIFIQLAPKIKKWNIQSRHAMLYYHVLAMTN